MNFPTKYSKFQCKPNIAVYLVWIGILCINAVGENLLEIKNKEITEKIDSLKVYQIQKTREMDSLAIVSFQLQKVIDSLNFDLNTLTPMVESVESSHAVIYQKHQKLQETLNARKESIKSNHRMIDSTNTYTDSLQKSSIVLQLRIDSLSLVKDSLSLALNKVLKDNAAFQKNNSIKLELNKSIQATDSIQQKIKNRKAEIASLESQNDSIKIQIESNKKQKQNLIKALDSIQLQVDLIQKQSKSLRITNGVLTISRDSLQSLVNIALQENSHVIENKELLKIQSKLQSEMDSLNLTLKNTKDFINKTHKANDSLKVHNKAMVAQQSQLKGSIDSLILANKTQLAKADSLQQEIIKNQQRADSLQPFVSERTAISNKSLEKLREIQAKNLVARTAYLQVKNRTDSLANLQQMATKEHELLEKNISNKRQLRNILIQRGLQLEKDHAATIIKNDSLAIERDSLKTEVVEVQFKNLVIQKKVNETMKTHEQLFNKVSELKSQRDSSSFRLDSLSALNNLMKQETEDLDAQLKEFHTTKLTLNKKQHELSTHNLVLQDAIQEAKAKSTQLQDSIAILTKSVENLEKIEAEKVEQAKIEAEKKAKLEELLKQLKEKETSLKPKEEPKKSNQTSPKENP